MFKGLEMQSYRDILKTELRRRSSARADYGQNAFARDAGIAPSRLSEIFNFKQGLSKKTAIKVSENLALGKTQREFFVTSVEFEHGRSKQVRELAEIKLKALDVSAQFNKVDEDSFKLISEWYHMAILELTNLKDFKFSYDAISEKLNVKKGTIVESIERLERLGLVKIIGDKLVPTNDYRKVNTNYPSAAIKQFHTQFIKKAEKSIYKQEMKNREHGTLLKAINKADLPKAQELIREFFMDFSQKLGPSKEVGADSLYALAIQFFELEGDQ